MVLLFGNQAETTQTQQKPTHSVVTSGSLQASAVSRSGSFQAVQQRAAFQGVALITQNVLAACRVGLSRDRRKESLGLLHA